MNRLGRAAIVAALATVAIRLLRSGDFGLYVQQRMRWPLVLAGAALVVFALHEAIRATRDERADLANRRRHAAPAVGWLLMAPVAVVIAVVPAGLGANAASRIDAYAPNDDNAVFAPLDASDGPVEMRVVDFIDRAVWDEQRSLVGVPVRLEGIVVNDPDVDGGFRLTRFLVSCCAADGIPLQVDVFGAPGPLEDDTWVAVDVVWRAFDADAEFEGAPPIEADLLSIRFLAEPPNDPYESPF